MSYQPRFLRDMGDALSDAGTGAKIGAAVGSFVPGIGTALGSAAGGLLGGVVGLFQKKSGNKLLKQSPYPGYAVPQEILANQQLAQNMANEGMPSAQYQDAMKSIQRTQAAALVSAQDRRMGSQLTGAIAQQGNDATAQLNAQSAAMRQANQKVLMGANQDVAAYRDKAFDWNQKNRYLQNWQYANQLIGAGNQNLVSGFDKLFSGVGNAYTAGLFNGGGGTPNIGNAGYQQAGVGLATPGGTGYTPGSNTDVILDPNAYSRIQLPQ